MIIERHSLAKELPEFKEQIHQLKISNAHFSRMFNEYHNIDNQVIRIEEGIENTSDEFLEGLKKKRLDLKDKLYEMLKAV